MRTFFSEHPYLRIYLIVILYATILFSWGKVFRDNEWYLDQVNLWIAIVASVIGTALSGLLLYFRYNQQQPGKASV